MIKILNKIKTKPTLSKRTHLGYVPTNHATTNKRTHLGYVPTFALFIAMLLSGCVNDEVNEPKKSVKLPDKVYIALTVSTPSETRSTTTEGGGSSDTPQSGIGNESKINSALLLFFKNNDGVVGDFISSFNATTEDKNNGKFVVSTEVKEEDIMKLVRQKLYLFVAANTIGYNLKNILKPEEALLTFDADGMKEVGEGQFVPMVNYEYFPIDFSKITDMEVFADLLVEDIFNVSENAKKPDIFTKANELKLERCVARVDYKPKTTGSNANLYQLGNTDYYVKIVGMQPFNLKKQSYLFRHTMEGTSTASNFTGTNTTDLFGVERDGTNTGLNRATGPYRWVADEDWGYKFSWNLQTGHFYLEPALAASGEYAPTGVWTEAKTSIPSDNDGYNPLWYISENTLPSVATMKRGLSTGVAFRVILCKDNQGSPFADSDFNNRNSKIKATRLSGNYYTISIDSKPVATAERLNDGSYALTYWYMMGHNVLTENAGHVPGDMDAMQFAVVRNNIYKLSVSSFSDFPDPFNPNEPDEPEKGAAIGVEVKVLSWAKHSVGVKW